MIVKVLPLAILKRFLKGDPSSCLEKGFNSAAITTSFFLGCLCGAFASDPILASYGAGHFTPVFTVFCFIIAMLCFWHYALCEYFCFNYVIEEELSDILQETIVQTERFSREQQHCRIHNPQQQPQGRFSRLSHQHTRTNTAQELLRIALEALERDEGEKEIVPAPAFDHQRRTDG